MHPSVFAITIWYIQTQLTLTYTHITSRIHKAIYSMQNVRFVSYFPLVYHIHFLHFNLISFSLEFHFLWQFDTFHSTLRLPSHFWYHFPLTDLFSYTFFPDSLSTTIYSIHRYIYIWFDNLSSFRDCHQKRKIKERKLNFEPFLPPLCTLAPKTIPFSPYLCVFCIVFRAKCDISQLLKCVFSPFGMSSIQSMISVLASIFIISTKPVNIESEKIASFLSFFFTKRSFPFIHSTKY